MIDNIEYHQEWKDADAAVQKAILENQPKEVLTELKRIRGKIPIATFFLSNVEENLKPKKRRSSKKPSKKYADADSALQHAVVRGEPKEVLDKLREIRDSLNVEKIKGDK